MSYKLKCTNCGYARLITSEWLEDLRMKFSSSISGLVVENIDTYLPRFKCSKCSAKAASIIKSKSPQHIPGQLGQRFPIKQSEQKKTEPTKWTKKTCPACNGEGLDGHCYKCDGTGWVEALF